MVKIDFVCSSSQRKQSNAFCLHARQPCARSLLNEYQINIEWNNTSQKYFIRKISGVEATLEPDVKTEIIFAKQIYFYTK